jgi:K+-transporting ATPase ATPase C chain
MKPFLSECRRAILAVALLTLLLGGVYPLATWGVGQLFFPWQANGSLLGSGQRPIGSLLIAQRFDGPAYFHPRPSAVAYAGAAARSGGSNLGPLSRQLSERVALLAREYRRRNGLAPGAPIAADAVSASASGLDPHISPGDAYAQADRVARARNWSRERVRGLIRQVCEGRQLGILGEKRVNVLRLNLALDGTGNVL